MSQLTLDNIETKMCPKCKRGLKCESIIDNEVTFFCPTCLKECVFTVCLNCGIFFEKTGYKVCSLCNAQGFKKMVVDNQKAKKIIVLAR